MSKKDNKIYLCQVQRCPMESNDAPMDDKLAHQNNLKKAFGDDYEVVKCERVESEKSGKTLFCEMLVKTSRAAERAHLPDGFRVIMEVETDV